VARFRRRYDPYDDYDPYDPYDPRNRRGWGRPRRYYPSAPGGSCLRDACLLETGCCIAESLDGNCLVLTLLTGPQLAAVLLGGAPDRGRPDVARCTVADRIVGGIRVYQREISARRPPVCRFTPSCSEYAAQAVAGHGALRGGLLALRRLVRCRPGGRRGPDPVPAASPAAA
jgi:putative membrane protein insertion efficiency factor